jgi:hypothetical protein
LTPQSGRAYDADAPPGILVPDGERLLHIKLVKPADARPWSLLGAVVAMAAIAIGCQAAGIRLCLFKRLTGIPCPTCGGTRAALHLLRGDPSAAWRSHPLAAALLLGVMVYAVLSAASLASFRRLPVLQASRRAWCWMGGLLLALAALNWGYLIVHAGM